MDDLTQNEEQKQTKINARIATTVYLILLPFSVLYAVFASCFDSSLANVFLNLCIPLSIPVTLLVVWDKYLNKKHKSCCRCCLIPVYVFVATQFIIEPLLRFLTR